MTATPGRTTFVQWYQGLPLGPINKGTNGQAEGAAWPAALDSFAVTLDTARKAMFPDYAPVDALPHIGNDRKLIQGQNESNASFQTRCKDAWGQWSRAGTPCSVLEQLYYFGLTNATWVQQNGLQYTFSGALTPGQDPTSLVVASNTASTNEILSSSASPYRTIPSGTPWWFFDSNTDLCNRFAIVVPAPWPFSSLVQVNFNNSDVATATWPVSFAGNYLTIYGPPTSPVILSVDGTATTGTTVTMRASAPWTGSVYVIGFAAGVDPFNTFSFASLGVLKKIISTFRPNAICAGVYAMQSGRMWGYPSTLKWGDGGTWGGASSQILGAF